MPMMTLDEQFLQTGQYAARVLSAGSGGDLVVVLASPLIHAGLYRSTASALAAHTRVAVVDLPGAGKGSRVDRPLSFEALSSLIPELVGALGARSCVLVGHSNSGPIALLVAVRYPGCVSGLVLVDSIGAHSARSLPPVLAGRIMDACLEPLLTLRGIPAIAYNLARHPRSFLSQLPEAAGDDWLPLATQVNVPTLIAWGRRDHTMPLANAARFQAAIPHAQVATSRTGSHDWIIEQPVRFAAAVMALLHGRGAAAPSVDGGDEQ